MSCARRVDRVAAAPDGADDEAGTPADVHRGQDHDVADPVEQRSGRRDGGDDEDADIGERSQVDERRDPADGAAHHAGELEHRQHQRDDEVGDQQRRREEAQGVLGPETPGELPTPDAGGQELAGELVPRVARPVGDPQAGVEPHQMAGLAEAEVHLPVLAAPDGLVEAADAAHCGRPHDAEVRRFRRPGLGVAGVVGRSAEAEAAVVGAGDGGLEARPSGGDHDAAEVGGVLALELGHAALRVVRLELGVGVDPDDDGMAGDGDGAVEADRDVHAGVVDHRDALVVVGHAVHERVGSVGGGRKGQDDLDGAVVVLREDARDGGFDVVDLVVDRHHVRDAGTRFRRRSHRSRLSIRSDGQPVTSSVAARADTASRTSVAARGIGLSL